ncbi:MAG: 16S rRNA (guanine(527)-N(7))-methyltransferase RsmG [Minwuia sp.]|nr:16S rRNA (guanine(527)-N(7))-methyltransferase RsmG [Minwuia sp.]
MDAQQFRSRSGVSRETVDRLRALEDLLNKWNPRINLVSRSTLGQFWSRHVLDSWQLVPLVSGDARSWIDLGSGGGFPGLVVAATHGAAVTLIESDARKCVFLREAARTMELNISVRNARLETVDDLTADVVSARALAGLPTLLDWVAPFMHASSVGALLKGQDVESELTEATKCWKFTCERHESLSDGAGSVLLIRGLQRHGQSTSQ